MSTIQSLDQVAEALDAGGYEVEMGDETVHLKVGGMDRPFVAVVTVNEPGTELAISCQLARWGDIPEKHLLQFAVACLDANTRIRPFAFATITASDRPDLDDPDEWPIVITNSVPLGDLSREELHAAMDSLWSALASGLSVLHIGFASAEG